MKKTIIVLMALAGVASAAVPMTLTPLSSTDDWTLGYKQYSGAKLAIDTANQTITATTPDQAGWGEGYGFYTLTTPIDLTETTDTLSFSFTLTQQDSDSLATVALVGNSQAIVMGAYYGWESIQYGLTSKGTNDGANKTYSAGKSTWTDYYSSGTDAQGSREDLVAIDTTNPVTVSGEIAWGTDQYVLTLTSGTTTKTLDLGTSVQLNQISIALDGPSSVFPAVSNISVVSTPEPATATLSLLALAGLAARRRRH